MNIKSAFPLAALASVLCLSSPVQALEAGDLILRAGATQVSPAGESGNTAAGANARIKADDNTQLGLTASYMFTNNFAVGVLAATPFKHKISSAGTEIAETKHLPPTITAQYHFSDLGSAKPYVGAGINYTAFFDEKLTNGTAIELDDSLGLAIEAGIDVSINEDLYFNASVWYIDIETKAKVGGTTALKNIDIDPVVVMLGLGTKF